MDVATTLAPLVELVLGTPPPIRVEFWDGSSITPAADAADLGSLVVRSADAVRRIAWSPNELGLGRAYVAGEMDVGGRAAVGGGGDLVDMLRAVTGVLTRRGPDGRLEPSAVVRALAAARRLGGLGRPLPPPPEEAHLRGRRHSIRRDASAIHHHYDTGNDFYRLVLGPSMTYSCARFADPAATLEAAQAAKHDLVARKLGLDEPAGDGTGRPWRLLDVGCGWGSMAIHAVAHYGVDVVGITTSQEQAKLARERVDAAGVGDRAEIRLQDYREIGGERFDAISSIGMSEHVGAARIDDYFGVLRGALVPHGRVLNHAISSIGGSRLGRRSFTGRYVFPDGELIDVGDVVLAMERAGFEVRDVESLREHYARTLRAWVANLEASWDEAVAVAGVAKARIWRLYMAGSAVGFGDGGIAVHQVLGVVPDDDGHVAIPPTRHGWV